MTRLEQARQRLETAVARLESAVKLSAAGTGDEGVHEKLAGELADALQATQAEYAALKDVTRSVSDRLDAAIARLRNVLGE
jgi:exonuclease VII small subunit